MAIKRSEYLFACKKMAEETTKVDNNNRLIKALKLDKEVKKQLEDSLESYQISLFLEFENKELLNMRLANFLKLVSITEDGSDYVELLQPLTTYVNGIETRKNVSIHDILRMAVGRRVQPKTEYGKKIFKSISDLKKEIEEGYITFSTVKEIPSWLTSNSFNSNDYFELNEDGEAIIPTVVLDSEEVVEKLLNAVKNMKSMAESDTKNGLFEPARFERVPISKFRKDFEMVVGNWFNQSLQLKDSITESKRKKRAENAERFSVSYNTEKKKYEVSGLNADFRRKVKSMLTLLDKNGIAEKADRKKYLDKIVEIYKESGSLSETDSYYREVVDQLKTAKAE